MRGFEHLFREDDQERSWQFALFVSKEDSAPDKALRPVPRFWRRCRHQRHRFELEHGLVVFASAWGDSPRDESLIPEGFSGPPDIGFYLDPVWASETLVVSPDLHTPATLTATPGLVVFPWPDWGVPENPRLLREALVWLLAEIAKGKVVEIGCMGGHGRTGAALACLLVLQGLSVEKATGRVWRNYCDKAIETKAQLSLIRSLA